MKEEIRPIDQGKATLKERLILWLAKDDVIILNCTMHCPIGWELHANTVDHHAFVANSYFRSYDPDQTTLESIPHTRILRAIPK